jgi:hypothetical protein
MNNETATQQFTILNYPEFPCQPSLNYGKQFHGLKVVIHGLGTMSEGHYEVRFVDSISQISKIMSDRNSFWTEEMVYSNLFSVLAEYKINQLQPFNG